MSKAREERIKLFAGYLSAIGAGTIVTGIIAPIAALIINPNLSERLIVQFGIAAFGLSVGLHVLRRRSLATFPTRSSKQ